VGPVTTIVSSPFHRHLFLSVGVDGNLVVRSSLQKHPLLSSSASMADEAGQSCAPVALNTADWSKARPLVFAVAGDSNVVLIYDLGKTQPMNPTAKIHIPRTTADEACPRALCLQYNPKVRDLLACGDSNGHVHIWQLSWNLSNAGPYEQELLRKFVEGLFYINGYLMD